MEHAQVDSPFKSPSVSSYRYRKRLGSGSSASSTEKESPPNDCHSGGSHHSNESEEGDENDPHAAAVGSDAVGGEHLRVNPFEKDVLAGLQRSFWSPSIMEIKETPPQRSWNIDHLSHLFPKDIENSPSTHQNAFPIDDQTEAKAQADIDTYFSRGPIVPTPSPMKEKVANFNCGQLQKTTLSYIHCSQSPIARETGNGGIKKKKLAPMTDKWTQTSISFPKHLPEHIQELLSQYCQIDDLCGTPGETLGQASQKSVASEPGDGGENDSGKSSSLNTSIRRRLDLSFGEEPESEELTAQAPALGSPIVDPFRLNHRVNTPPNCLVVGLNTTTTELEMQLMRCEFTPEARVVLPSGTPALTPIQDEPNDVRFNNVSSTPRRLNVNSNRWTEEHLLESPMEQSPIHKGTVWVSNSGGNPPPISLRRSRASSPLRKNRKTSSASSFNDSNLMDENSPPAKLYRRNSDKS